MLEEFLSEKQKRKRKRRRYFGYAVLVLITYGILWGVAWIIVRSPLFRVNNIIVEGASDIPQADIVSLLQGSVLRKGDAINASDSGIKAVLGFHNMLVWPSSLPQQDLNVIPQLETLSISKDYFSHTIIATITEKQPFGIWCLVSQGASAPAVSSSTAPASNESCYWFDDHGIVFEHAFDTEGSLLLSIHDSAQSHLALLSPVLPEEFVPNLISIINVIQSSSLPVSDIALNDLALEQVNVTLTKGPVLYFSLRFPADEDLPVLQSLMAKPDFSKLQYIDFTVENRAFYK